MKIIVRTLLCLIIFVFVNAVLVPAVNAQIFCGGFFATIIGTPFNDVIFGTPFQDVIHGLAGNDDIRGFGGNDIICGGVGNDTIRGGAGNDLMIGGPGNDSIFGQLGNDILRGGIGNDFLNGNNGNDVLNGQAGGDTCNGGFGFNTLISCNDAPPTICQSPFLTTNFGNLGVLFVDSFHSILMGLYSDGFNVEILLTDIPFNGAAIDALAFTVSSTHCVVDAAISDTDEDGFFGDEFIVPAAGDCFLEFNRTQLVLDDFIFIDRPLGFDVIGQCAEVVVLNSASSERGQSASVEDMTKALSEAMLLKQQELTEELRNEDGSDADDEGGAIEDFQREVEAQQ